MMTSNRGVKIKKIGERYYAYDMISYWSKEQKRYRKKSIYLGTITNLETKEYKPKDKTVDEKDKLIQNFGDTYSIIKVIEFSPWRDVLKSLLPSDYETLISLVCHKIIKSSAMQYVENWSRGNIVSTLFPKAELSSQRISDFLKKLGKETIWRKFFKDYINRVAGEKVGIIIDSTDLPNETHMPLTAWSHREQETKLLMVIDRISGNPLYFRYTAGNVVDVSTLTSTFAELEQLGVKTSFALVDAGYYSESNIRELYLNHISFLTRLPSGRTLYKSLLKEHTDVESAANVVVYGKRALYVKCVPVDLFGNQGFAYIACDIRRKADETTRLFIAAKEDRLSSDEIEEQLCNKGKFIIISSDKISIDEIIPLYYTRQTAENLFGISKSFLDLLPIRTHALETFRGYLMLTFISLIVYLEMQKRLDGKFTVEGALTEMTNLMAKIYDDTIIISEPTKNMKAIAGLFGYMVPKKVGE